MNSGVILSTLPLFSVSGPIQVTIVSVVKGLSCTRIGSWDEFLCSFESIFRASHSIFTRTIETLENNEAGRLLLSVGLQRIKYWSTGMCPLSTTSYFLYHWEDSQQFSLLCPCPFTFSFPEQGFVDHLSVYCCCSLGIFSWNLPSEMQSVYWVS